MILSIKFLKPTSLGVHEGLFGGGSVTSSSMQTSVHLENSSLMKQKLGDATSPEPSAPLVSAISATRHNCTDERLWRPISTKRPDLCLMYKCMITSKTQPGTKSLWFDGFLWM